MIIQKLLGMIMEVESELADMKGTGVMLKSIPLLSLSSALS